MHIWIFRFSLYFGINLILQFPPNSLAINLPIIDNIELPILFANLGVILLDIKLGYYIVEASEIRP